MIVLTSLPWIRQMAYGIFLTCHITGLVLFLVGLALHVPEAVPYCLAGACLYGADVLIRVTRTRIATASLQAVPGCDSTMVSMAGLREGWRAGQHVILRIPKLGGLGGIEGHEFTIASAPDADGLTLIVKNVSFYVIFCWHGAHPIGISGRQLEQTASGHISRERKSRRRLEHKGRG